MLRDFLDHLYIKPPSDSATLVAQRECNGWEDPDDSFEKLRHRAEQEDECNLPQDGTLYVLSRRNLTDSSLEDPPTVWVYKAKLGGVHFLRETEH